MIAVSRANGGDGHRRPSQAGGVRPKATSYEDVKEHLVDALDGDKNALKRLLKALFEPDAAPSRPQERIVLDARAPLDIARRFVEEYFQTEAGVRLLHARDKDLFRWEDSHYILWSDADARADLYTFLEHAVRATNDGHQPFRPSQRVANEVLDALRAAAHIPSRTAAPAWLDGRGSPPVNELVVCGNGILHIPTRTLYPHDAALFATSALPFAYEGEGPEPGEWLRFLGSVWPDDEEAVRTLQEVFGYLVSGDTHQQKIFLLVGPKRSGKGTIGRVIRALLGEANTIGPTLSSMTGQFGIESFQDRSLAVISDARLSRRVDQAIITERLLAISGEDVLTVDRKHRQAWTGKLPTRVLVLTNLLPHLTDSSGALASRFLTLTMKRSFFGREDLGLEARLMKELPGILRWALEGWDRLQKRGYFVPPASSQQAAGELEDLGSPVSAFLREQCVVDAGAETPTDVLYQAWRDWCKRQGHDRVSTAPVFGRDLRGVVPGLSTAQRGSGTDRTRVYVGVGLKSRRTR